MSIKILFKFFTKYLHREKEIIEKKPTKYDYAKEKQEKIVPKEVEIPLDFDGDKSPQAAKSKTN